MALLRQAISECGYTFDALEAATGKPRSYLHGVLNGEKHLRLDFVLVLPPDVRARYARLAAESYGFIVVQPAPVESAAMLFVAGLMGLLKPVMAKADGESAASKERIA